MFNGNLPDSTPVQKWANSLTVAFGAAVTATVCDGLLRLTIGDKTAWINQAGELEGESRVCMGAFSVGVHEDSGVVPASRAAVMA